MSNDVIVTRCSGSVSLMAAADAPGRARARSRIFSSSRARADASGYSASGRSRSTETSRSVSKPRSVLITFAKLRSSRPAPVMRTSAIATSAAIRNRRVRCPDADPLRPPVLSPVFRSTPDTDTAGARPKSSTVSAATTAAKRNTGIDSSPMPGRIASDGASASIPFVTPLAITRPAIAPATARIVDSARS